jgi:hypothetical protein
VNYNFLNESQQGIEYTGLIAQDVEETLNQLGLSFSGLEKPANQDSYYSLRYADFIVPLVKAVQEQQQAINMQKAYIDELQKAFDALKSQIEKN